MDSLIFPKTRKSSALLLRNGAQINQGFVIWEELWIVEEAPNILGSRLRKPDHRG